MSHAAITLIAQILSGCLLGRWAMGGIMMSFFYIGREITQAEYRWISEYGGGRRANMPFWGGFDPAVWNMKSFGDMLYPIIATLAVCIVVRYLQRRSAPRAKQ